jgi:transcriptional regulator with XRE-family HTH domain
MSPPPKQVQMIGYRLCALRRARKLTQAELADRLGVNRTTICCWESGQRKLDLIALADMAKALKMKLETLCKKLLEDIDYESHRNR